MGCKNQKLMGVVSNDVDRKFTPFTYIDDFPDRI
jgi:hypothetical protein